MAENSSYVSENDTKPNETYEYYYCYDYSYYEESKTIKLIGFPILIIMGTIGNMLAFYVMRRGSLRKVSTCFYMAILAWADTGVLWSGGFMSWFGFLTNFKYNPDSYTDCKLGYFLFFFTLHFSSFLLAAMSIEKFIALYFPLKAKTVCTVKTAKWVTFVIALVLLLFDGQMFFIVKSDSNRDCKFIVENYEGTYYRLDSILYSFVPFSVMIIANSAIIFKFMRARYKSKEGGPQQTSQALSKSASKGTAMLITVSITFLLLTGPIAFLYTITPNANFLADAITLILQYLNHSINGILYCISGPKFRAELAKTFGFWRKNRVEDLTSGGKSTTGGKQTPTVTHR